MTSPTTSPTHILIVEDHADTRDCVARILRNLGFTTVTADSCTAARAVARTSPVDAVISDVGLPDGDGVALMEELKARYGLPCVALTGHVMVEDVRRYERSSVDCILAKPTGVMELGRVVRALTDSIVRPAGKRRSA